MKILHSQLKNYIPDLNISPKEVAEIFTLIGYMKDGAIKEVDYLGKADYLTELEVRQNRADCLGVQGLAKDLAAYLNLNFNLDLPESINTENLNSLPIRIKVKDSVKRLMAVKIEDIKVKESPNWLKSYLDFYEINSINNLVDLTNYIMIEFGHPSHAFDADISGGSLIWEINSSYKEMTSLDGTMIKLSEDALVISNGDIPLALAGLVGGDKAAIDHTSKNVIIEMAVYDGGLVRNNSRKMKILTEASARLEKFMDPGSIDNAFFTLVNMILENCDGKIGSKVFDEYNVKKEKNKIKVNLEKVKQVAGIEINYNEAIFSLKNLGFEITEKKLPIIKVERPINRLDIEQEADVFEEIIRMYGYDKLPTNNLTVNVVKDITPDYLKLIDKIKHQLTSNGFDEIRSWVLVEEAKNLKGNFFRSKAIKAQNSVNEEVSALRQTLSAGLVDQVGMYKKLFVKNIRLFEIGKIFYDEEGVFKEHYSLGVGIEGNSFNKLKNILEKILGLNGISVIKYSISKNRPLYAHPYSIFSIQVPLKDDFKEIGVIYVVNEVEAFKGSYFEINLSLLSGLIKKQDSSTVELRKKLVSLDSNIILNEDASIIQYLAQKVQGNKEIWSWEIIDEYAQDKVMKYTIRITYYNLSDTKAKELHKKIFS